MTILNLILEKYSNKNDLIDALEDIQDEFGFISEDSMRAIEKSLGVSLVEVYGVVTFYSEFKLSPSGSHVIKICKGTACHVKRSDSIQEAIEERLDIKEGETSSDGKFSFEVVNCMGACAKAPAIMIDDVVYGDLDKDKVVKIIDGFV